MAGITGKKPLDFGAQTIADLKTVLGLDDAESLTAFFYTPVDKTDNYILELTDAWKSITMTSATEKTVTIPLNSVVAFPLNVRMDVLRYGAGEVTIAGSSGVTLNSESSWKKIGAQYAGVTLIQTAIDTWVILGRLKA